MAERVNLLEGEACPRGCWWGLPTYCATIGGKAVCSDACCQVGFCSLY